MADGVSAFADLIPEIWSAKMYDELRKNLIFANLFSRDYEGDLKTGDIVRINQWVAPTAELLDSDLNQFNTSAIDTNQLTITADKTVSVAHEITDLATLQSLSFQDKLREGMTYALAKKLDDMLISIMIPSAAAPVHQIAPTTTSVLAAADFVNARKLLGLQSVPLNERFWVADPIHFSSLLDEQTFMSREYLAGNNSEGQITKYLGFNLYESDNLGSAISYCGHPSALALVMQRTPRVQLSNQHPNRKYGWLISMDMTFGYKLMDSKRIVKISG
jgi:hypothetical protein